MKTDTVDIFGEYEIEKVADNGDVIYHISVKGEKIEGYYFTNLDTALLMCLIKKYLKDKPDQEQEDFAKVMATMINMYKNSGE